MEILTTLSAGIAKAPCPVVAFHTAQVSTAWANEAYPSGQGRCWSPEFLINGLRLLLQTLVGIFRGAWHMRVVYPSFLWWTPLFLPAQGCGTTVFEFPKSISFRPGVCSKTHSSLHVPAV